VVEKLHKIRNGMDTPVAGVGLGVIQAAARAAGDGGDKLHVEGVVVDFQFLAEPVRCAYGKARSAATQFMLDLFMDGAHHQRVRAAQVKGARKAADRLSLTHCGNGLQPGLVAAARPGRETSHHRDHHDCAERMAHHGRAHAAGKGGNEGSTCHALPKARWRLFRWWQRLPSGGWAHAGQFSGFRQNTAVLWLCPD